MESRTTERTASPVHWRNWVLLPLFAFLSLTFAVIALAVQGSGFVLLAGTVVCGMQAVETWRSIRRAANEAS